MAYPDTEGTISRAGLLFFIEHFTESFCYYLSIIYPFLLMLFLLVYMLCRSGGEITPLYPSRNSSFPHWGLIVIDDLFHLFCHVFYQYLHLLILSSLLHQMLCEGLFLCRRMHEAALQPEISLIPLHQPCDTHTPTLSAFSPTFNVFSKADPKCNAAVSLCIS